MDLEILEYDVEGAAYRDGVVVDGAFLLATVRRRPAGEVVHLRTPVATLDVDTKARLFAAFGALEAVVKEVSERYYEAQASDPKALDAKIDAATRADKHVETAKLEAARIEAENLVKRAEIEELDRNLAVMREASEAKSKA